MPPVWREVGSPLLSVSLWGSLLSPSWGSGAATGLVVVVPEETPGASDWVSAKNQRWSRAFLTSNLSVLKKGPPRCGAAARTCEAQQTGLVLASWRLLVFVQPTRLHRKRKWLKGGKEQWKDEIETVSYYPLTLFCTSIRLPVWTYQEFKMRKSHLETVFFSFRFDLHVCLSSDGGVDSSWVYIALL